MIPSRNRRFYLPASRISCSTGATESQSVWRRASHPTISRNWCGDRVACRCDPRGGLEGDAAALPPLPIDAYLEVLPGPDFPTGATIHGSEGIRSMYATGKGRFHVRAKASIVENATGGSSIVVTEIPYQVKKAGMLEATADLIRQDRITGIRDIRDESSKDGLRIVFEVKQNADANAVLNQLYLTTRLQESYAANMMGIVDGQPTQLTLPVILHAYVRHREEVVVRRTEFDLEKAERRMHILEGLIRAEIESTMSSGAGRSSESKAQFERVLMGQEIIDGIAPFDFSEVQARSIAERRLYQLSRMDVQSVKDEHEALSERILDLRDLLGSRARRLRVLVDELNDVTRNHGDQRRTGIVSRELSMDPEDLVAEEAVVITLSEGDYVRRIPVEAFRTQNRGGRGFVASPPRRRMPHNSFEHASRRTGCSSSRMQGGSMDCERGRFHRGLERAVEHRSSISCLRCVTMSA